jgi:hypothetical protein
MIQQFKDVESKAEEPKDDSQNSGTWFINAAHMNDEYLPRNPPYVIRYYI